jgi:hypothetical protein
MFLIDNVYAENQASGSCLPAILVLLYYATKKAKEHSSFSSYGSRFFSLDLTSSAHISRDFIIWKIIFISEYISQWKMDRK